MTKEKMYHGDLTEWMDYNAAYCDDYIPGCLLDNMVIRTPDDVTIFAYERAATEWTSYYELYIYQPNEHEAIEQELEHWTELYHNVYKEIYGEDSEQ